MILLWVCEGGLLFRIQGLSPFFAAFLRISSVFPNAWKEGKYIWVWIDACLVLAKRQNKLDYAVMHKTGATPNSAYCSIVQPEKFYSLGVLVWKSMQNRKWNRKGKWLAPEIYAQADPPRQEWECWKNLAHKSIREQCIVHFSIRIPLHCSWSEGQSQT
jgi:hypothetical protein